MAEKRYNLIVIGAGPGGYRAAARAGALGKKTLLVEKDTTLGGVCLNRGCIPTKALLNSAKIFYAAQNSVEMGVSVSGARYDLKKAMEWKSRTVKTLTKGIEYQMRRHNVEVVAGTAKIESKGVVSVDQAAFTSENIIIATGSSPVRLPIPGAEMPHVLTSDELLQIQVTPRNVVVIGGGVIGIEFASYFSMLGCHVTVIEMLPEILPSCDKDIAALMRAALKRCNFLTCATVVSVDQERVTVLRDGKEESLPADIVLQAVGRRPNVEGLGLENISLDFDKGGIRVDEHLRTNVPTVYAIGDVTGQSFLAHSAYRMGDVAVNNMFGGKDRMRYHAIPWVVYGSPELSGVGLTEDEAKKKGHNIKVGTVQLRANGRFLAEHGNEKGICKIVVDGDSNVLLGVTILGGVNSEIIYGAAAMLEGEFRVQDINDVVFPHPSVSEALQDALWELN